MNRKGGIAMSMKPERHVFTNLTDTKLFLGDLGTKNSLGQMECFESLEPGESKDLGAFYPDEKLLESKALHQFIQEGKIMEGRPSTSLKTATPATTAIRHPFIDEVVDLLEKENMFVGPGSGFKALSLKLPKAIDKPTGFGSVWIEGLEGNKGQVVIRIHAQLTELKSLPDRVGKLVSNTVPLLENFPTYKMRIEVRDWPTDASEPEDAPINYSATLFLSNDVFIDSDGKSSSSPEAAFRHARAILNQPIEFLVNLLSDVKE